MDPAPRIAQPDPQRWRALSVALAAGFMTLLDVSIVNVALPSIREVLGASDVALQWIVSGYALTFGLVLVLAGRLGDALGRRPVFVTGVVIFTGASLAAGMSPTAGWLVAARLVQGIGAGVLNPQLSGLIQDLFVGPERGRAFGRLGTAIGISSAVGPVVGGLILTVVGIQHGWRGVFLLNLPIGLVVVLLARHYVPRKPEPEPVRDLDLAGALLLGCGVVGLLWPLLSEQHHPRSVAVALVGAVLLLVFAWWERRADRVGQVPMVRPSLFSRPGYSTGTLLSLVYFSGFTGVFFLLTLYFQNGVGYTPLQAGLGLTPFALGTAVSSSIGGRLVPRLGRRQVLGGLLLVVAGFSVADLMLTFGAPGLGAGWWLAAPLLLAGAGSGLMMSANMTLALENVPLDQAGAAAGVLQTGQRLGSATGVAVVGALFFAGVAGGAPLQAAAAHGMHAVVGLTVVASVIALLELVRRR